jgi:hypothetical protein
LYGDVEDDEAVLWVVSEWRGEPWSSSAMVVCEGVVHYFVFSQRTEKVKKERGSGGAREEQEERLGFLVA